MLSSASFQTRAASRSFRLQAFRFESFLTFINQKQDSQPVLTPISLELKRRQWLSDSHWVSLTIQWKVFTQVDRNGSTRRDLFEQLQRENCDSSPNIANLSKVWIQSLSDFDLKPLNQSSGSRFQHLGVEFCKEISFRESPTRSHSVCKERIQCQVCLTRSLCHDGARASWGVPL